MERLYSKRSIKTENEICDVGYYSSSNGSGDFGIKIVSNLNDSKHIFKADNICRTIDEAMDILKKMEKHKVTPLSAEESLEEIMEM